VENVKEKKEIVSVKRQTKTSDAKIVMVGVCERCGRLLIRPEPCTHGVCVCKGNPKPVLVKLRPMRQSGD